MARNLRKTLKKNSLKKIKGGGDCNCDKNVSIQPLVGGGKCGQGAAYSAGGGKKRKFRRSKRYSKKTRKTNKSRKLRKSKKSRTNKKRKVKGGASAIGGIINENVNRLQNFHGHSMWGNAGPLESQGSKLTRDVLNARQHTSNDPLSQPVEFKYGDHNTPLV